jgi:hypothetical protein
MKPAPPGGYNAQERTSYKGIIFSLTVQHMQFVAYLYPSKLAGDIIQRSTQGDAVARPFAAAAERRATLYRARAPVKNRDR